MNELKPCPFCGSEARIRELESATNKYSISCAEKIGGKEECC